MAQVSRPLPAQGTRLRAKGCITRLHFVINRPGEQLEDILGYHRGRLKQGWALLLMTEPAGPNDYVFAGHTHFSGGRIGHPNGGDARLSADDSLRQMLGLQGFDRMRARIAGEMTISGPERIAKIIPAIGHDDDMSAPDQYPPGGGAPQWILTAEKDFIVAAVVPAGHFYRGGGPGSGGFWVEPKGTHTL